jgi:phospholipid/cholesterol/gamma-HCH transport system substrate-binding protein
MRTDSVVVIWALLFVLLGLGALAFLTMQLPAKGLEVLGEARGYEVTAQFGNIGSLAVGDPVTMAGIPIGRVAKIALDRVDYEALVTLRLRAEYNRIPADSEASIDTVGLLGGQYVAIGPGQSKHYLSNGSRFESTHSAFVLENSVNRLFAILSSKAAGEAPSR